MTTISNNGIVTFSRGDTISFPLFINVCTKINPVRYNLAKNDVVYVAIEEANQPWEFAVLKQKYTQDDLNEYGDIVLKLKSEDTQCLLPGKYYYEVKLVKYKIKTEVNEETGLEEEYVSDEIEAVNTVIPRRQLFMLD